MVNYKLYWKLIFKIDKCFLFLVFKFVGGLLFFKGVLFFGNSGLGLLKGVLLFLGMNNNNRGECFYKDLN